jgi:hypothetical protein
MSTFLLPRLLLLALLAVCGQKSEGTSYSVNPTKHPDGHLLIPKDSGRVNTETTRGMPKAAEATVISNGGTQGQTASGACNQTSPGFSTAYRAAHAAR